MTEPCVISRGTTVRGRITGSADLIVLGLVEGDIQIDGDVTVEAEGMVGANIVARTLTIRGAVRGDLRAEDSINLEQGARVEGDLVTQRLAVADGALVRGHVQVGDLPPKERTQAVVAKAVSPAAPRPMARPAATSAPMARPAMRPAVIPARPPSPPPRIVERPAATGRDRDDTADAGQPQAGPPVPLVPALKKGAKATIKKK